VRLNKVCQDYIGRVNLRERPFPLEIYGGEAAPRDILEQEWWLAAIQEPEAQFNRFRGDDWPTTTLPAFQAVWSVAKMEPNKVHDFDLRVRRAFFAEGRNIGKRETMLDLAGEASLDISLFTRLLDSDDSRASVLKEAKLGKEHFGVRGTPSIMLSDGTRLRHVMAFPHLRERKIVAVDRLPCHAESCMESTRNLFEQALKRAK
jgi:predicted DsbA family dithiol-disulfide isomerase